ncbi:MAG: CvpA family protein [Clostridia bacterium]|nr:CvpA family protein [Clostridia bacterium]
MLLSVSSTMGIVFDVIIVAILAIFGLIGLRKGFFKSVLSMLSTLVVIIISIFCAGHLANLINKIYDFNGLIADKLSSGIASMGAFYSETIPAGVSGQDLINNIPSSTNGFLKKLMSYVLKPLSASDVQGATVADIVSGSFASIIMLIICAIILFIAIKIIISLVSRLFDNITRNRVFGATNKLLGLAFGVVKGGIIVVIFAFVLTLLTVIPAVNTKISPAIQDHSKIARPIYNYTDEFVEKHVVDGKIVQKWIDNLWENKYKDRGDDTTPDTTPNGSVEKPYQLSITESEGVYIATITIDFTNATEQYYQLNPSEISTSAFSLAVAIVGEQLDYVVTSTSDMNTEIENLLVLSKTETYVIKFAKGVEAQVQATFTLTPITE